MKSRLNLIRWAVICGLLLSLSITSMGTVQAAGLTQQEVDKLIHMREEEKLARDVYIFLNKLWGARIFSNISASEQTHMDAVKTLLDRYGVSDPAAGKKQGEFSDPELQALYWQLTQQGSTSLVEAYKVGVAIEEMDIADLEEGIKTTTHKDIKNVYSNLLEGSKRHLAAFQYNL